MLNQDDPIRLTTKASNNRLAAIREMMGFTKSAMADHLGMYPSQYGEIENLKRYPSKVIAERIAAALHYEVEYVFPDFLRKVSETVAVTSIPEADILLSLRDPEVLALPAPSDERTGVDEIEDELGLLDPREEKVIRMRFGFDGTEYTLEEIGKEFGISRSRVGQIENLALRKLRHPSRSKRLRHLVDPC